MRGVTEAEGTEEVGVVATLLGVTAAEDCPDSDSSSCRERDGEGEREGGTGG